MSQSADITTEPRRPKQRRKFALSLRASMALVLVLAVAMAWQVDKAREQREAAQAIRDCGGTVRYDWEFVISPGTRPPNGIYWRDVWGKLTPGRRPKAPSWLRALGDEYFQEIVYVTALCQKRPGYAARLTMPARN